MHLTLAWVITLGSIFLAVSPRLLPAFVILLAVLLVAHLWRQRQVAESGPLLPLPTVIVPFLGLGLWAMSSSLWSPDPDVAIRKGAMLIAFSLVAVATFQYCQCLSALERWRCVRGAVVGLLIGATLLAIDFLFTHNFSRVLINHTGLAHSAREFATLDSKGRVATLFNFYFNGQVAAINIVLWPTALLALYWQPVKFRSWVVGSLVGVAAIATMMSDSAASQLALLVGLTAFFIARSFPLLAYRVSKGLWSVAVLLIIPIILIAYQAGLQNVSSLAFSAKDRMHIWHYTVHEIGEHPFFGTGVRSGRAIIESHKDVASTTADTLLVDHAGWHPHDIFLQVWQELGAVGIAILLTLGLVLLRAISRLDDEVRPFAYANFAAITTLAALAHGMWQSWVMATQTWSVVLFLFALNEHNRRKTSEI